MLTSTFYFINYYIYGMKYCKQYNCCNEVDYRMLLYKDRRKADKHGKHRTAYFNVSFNVPASYKGGGKYNRAVHVHAGKYHAGRIVAGVDKRRKLCQNIASAEIFKQIGVSCNFSRTYRVGNKANEHSGHSHYCKIHIFLFRAVSCKENVGKQDEGIPQHVGKYEPFAKGYHRVNAVEFYHYISVGKAGKFHQKGVPYYLKKPIKG